MCCKNKAARQRTCGAGSRQACGSCGRHGACRARCNAQRDYTVTIAPGAVMSDAKSKHASFAYPAQTAGQPPVYAGTAPAPTLLPLVVPTSTAHLASGFPFTPALSHFDISPAAWAAFTQELIAVAKMPARQNHCVVGSVASVLFMRSWSKTRNVDTSYANGQNGVAAVMARWNAELFASRGLEARLVAPEGRPGCYGKRYTIVLAHNGSAQQREVDIFHQDQMNEPITGVTRGLGSPPPYPDEKRSYIEDKNIKELTTVDPTLR